ncbi:hypothetical protein B566_EDAN003924 [Ephemera danica]|nr:hypothetical protein B566_EDAN003924 [Ephemera danica]
MRAMMQPLSWIIVLILLAAYETDKVSALTGQKIIIDTDAGVDDAFAIAILLTAEAYNEVEILAITTVSGNTGVQNASLNVLKVLDTAGRLDIPVYQGAENALEINPPYDFYFGYDGFGDFEYPNAPNASFILPIHGVVALLQYVNAYPDEIVLLCLGPLTNYALATRLDPTFPSKVKQVINLGGSAEGTGNVKPNVEFNYYFDPLAAFIFHNTTKNAPVMLVTWESIAVYAILTLDWRVNVLGRVPGPMMELLNKAEYSSLNKGDDKWVSGDALAAAVFINPALILSANLQPVSVEVHSTKLAGSCMVDYFKVLGAAPNSVIIKNIDIPAYQAMLIEYLSS